VVARVALDLVAVPGRPDAADLPLSLARRGEQQRKHERCSFPH
jgi:hypothetical protein